ncbi:uncharacterized protein [Gossypium hirsutum]|uniref:Retrotransposon gag domain-containing protein n=1 Tax=Gossypium hirsutum TaxID=3635 RepID=A0ABM2Z6E7_GOSHI|nr:uncharacterized protein LOC121209979 [Gossypium hirsutum]
MSSRGTHGRSTIGRGRGRRRAQAESLAYDTILNLDTSETPISPTIEIGSGSFDSTVGDDALSQAMLRNLERVTRPNTEYWMEVTEHIMDDLDFSAEQKLKGVVLLLPDEVYQWWLIVRRASYIDARRREFLNLTQGDRSVAEYEAEFLRLSRYARGMVATEYECYVRFEDGLRDSLRVLIAPQREQNFFALVEKMKISEEVKRTKRQNQNRGMAKRDVEPSNSGIRPRKKARTNGPLRVGPTIEPSRVTICQHCNRHHPGECWRATRACLKYGSTKYRVKDCLLRINQIGTGPTETRQPALVYAARRREDRDTLDVISSIGSTHPYVASIVSETLGLPFESTSSEIVVMSLLGQSIEVSKLFRDVPLEVQGTVFLVDLMELPFGEFVLILGMDWLDIRPVRNFSDVFPKELPGLPPSLEVEFGIELIPGITPVSIASYRMASKELTELKAQIQSLWTEDQHIEHLRVVLQILREK